MPSWECSSMSMVEKQNEISTNMSDIERSWLACALDAEGYIILKHGKYPGIGVYNTDLRFVIHAARLMDVRPRVHTQPKKPTIGVNYPRKQMYTADLTGTRAQKILKQVIPFLIIKKSKAEELIKLEIMTREEYRNFLRITKYTRCKKGHYIIGTNIAKNFEGKEICFKCHRDAKNHPKLQEIKN